ncbi:MAG: hypothetical protein GY884_24905 [Proteobacteria bacterium]|nr:hypothetical protein [Pseudomonadota bacterium]
MVWILACTIPSPPAEVVLPAFDCALELDVSGSDAYRFDPGATGGSSQRKPANSPC